MNRFISEFHQPGEYFNLDWTDMNPTTNSVWKNWGSIIGKYTIPIGIRIFFRCSGVLERPTYLSGEFKDDNDEKIKTGKVIIRIISPYYDCLGILFRQPIKKTDQAICQKCKKRYPDGTMDLLFADAGDTIEVEVYNITKVISIEKSKFKINDLFKFMKK
jgi:hypothetical protein